MIPEFKFKSKDTYQKKQELKKFLKEKLADRKVRFTGAASIAALGIVLVGLTAFAGPDKETTKKESVTALLQTAGVTTQINTKENQLQEEIKKVSISKKEDAAMTGMTLASAAGVDVSAVTEDSVEEEIAAEAASEAVLAAASQQAAAPAQPEPEPEPAQPVHPQLVGFTNPGIANVEQYVNIRVEPNENATICGKLGKNAGCEILSENNGWYEIITNGVQGYIKSEFLITGEEAWQLADQLKYAYVRVITETLYVREQPNTESGIIELASLDQKLALLEEQPEWVKVQIDGKEGYMNKSYIAIEYTLPKGEAVEVEKKETKEEKEKGKDKDSKSKSKSSSSSSKPAKDCSSVVSYAKQFVGNPYVYGGTSLTKGADCSGFTMSVYAKFGVYLPHSSSAQSRCGTKVSASDIQPGDLIFYGSGSSVNHVALYIGGGQIVHASTERTGIKISNAFYRTPVTIRRVK